MINFCAKPCSCLNQTKPIRTTPDHTITDQKQSTPHHTTPHHAAGTCTFWRRSRSPSPLCPTMSCSWTSNSTHSPCFSGVASTSPSAPTTLCSSTTRRCVGAGPDPGAALRSVQRSTVFGCFVEWRIVERSICVYARLRGKRCRALLVVRSCLVQ